MLQELMAELQGFLKEEKQAHAADKAAHQLAATAGIHTAAAHDAAIAAVQKAAAHELAEAVAAGQAAHDQQLSSSHAGTAVSDPAATAAAETIAQLHQQVCSACDAVQIAQQMLEEQMSSAAAELVAEQANSVQGLASAVAHQSVAESALAAALAELAALRQHNAQQASGAMSAASAEAQSAVSRLQERVCELEQQLQNAAATVQNGHAASSLAAQQALQADLESLHSQAGEAEAGWRARLDKEAQRHEHTRQQVRAVKSGVMVSATIHCWTDS